MARVIMLPRALIMGTLPRALIMGTLNSEWRNVADLRSRWPVIRLLWPPPAKRDKLILGWLSRAV